MLFGVVMEGIRIGTNSELNPQQGDLFLWYKAHIGYGRYTISRRRVLYSVDESGNIVGQVPGSLERDCWRKGCDHQFLLIHRESDPELNSLLGKEAAKASVKLLRG